MTDARRGGDDGIAACVLPAEALLGAYRDIGYTDCYVTTIGRAVSYIPWKSMSIPSRVVRAVNVNRRR